MRRRAPKTERGAFPVRGHGHWEEAAAGPVWSAGQTGRPAKRGCPESLEKEAFPNPDPMFLHVD